MSSRARTEFYTAPLNQDTRVTAEERFADRVVICDDTLREGQQAAEVALSPDEEVQVAIALAQVGVPAAQVGFAGADDARVRRLHRACPELDLAVLSVGWRPDAAAAMESAKAAGAEVVSVLFRSSDAHLAALGLSRSEALTGATRAVADARRAGFRHVLFSPSFSTMADGEFLMELYEAAVGAGADVITLADSTGAAKPATIRLLVEQMLGLDGTAAVRVHLHNDFGLALANTLAAAAAGATWLDATVLGLGERAGNCGLEELVVALEGLYEVDTGVQTDRLFALCSLVAELSGVSIPPMKPAVGSDVFANKLEIHVQAAARDARLMEPYDPAVVGNSRSVKLGKGTGPTGVRLKLDELALSLSDHLVGMAVTEINARAVAAKRSISDDEFRALVHELADAAAAS